MVTLRFLLHPTNEGKNLRSASISFLFFLSRDTAWQHRDRQHFHFAQPYSRLTIRRAQAYLTQTTPDTPRKTQGARTECRIEAHHCEFITIVGYRNRRHRRTRCAYHALDTPSILLACKEQKGQ
ncbi:hypothetical protein [Vibrio pectenicida]|uniref:hypothetical protein n=1 Tax=Vibrio pectenicida TaxID=62763 RepID=UPI00163974D7|nr:hypothetical protein [Vibrio pectenicida]